MTPTKKEQRITIEVHQQDWMPGFAAFSHDGKLHESSKAHIVINIGSLACATELDAVEKEEWPYIMTENLLHEFVHVLEAWAKVEFNEDRVEAIVEKYRQEYGKKPKPKNDLER